MACTGHVTAGHPPGPIRRSARAAPRARVPPSPVRRPARRMSRHDGEGMFMKLFHISLAVLLAAIGVGSATLLTAQSAHVQQNAAEAKWGPAPPMLPAGAEIAVVSGDPGKPAPYVVRLK